MTKHNKKRNVGIIYELLLKHMSNCLIEGKIKDLKKATKIFEKRFAKGTELYKEFRLFNALAKTTASDTHIVASILSEAKNAARNCNQQKLSREKTALIHDINYNIKDKQFYYRTIDNYRDLATIQVLINEWRETENRNIQKLIEFEKKVGENLLMEKVEKNLTIMQQELNASDSDKLVLKIMTEKLNKKYQNVLSESEKEIVRNYSLYNQKNRKYLESYLKSKKDEALKLLEDFELKENNKILVEKVENVRTNIEKLKIKNIDDNSIVRFLTLSKLITEMNTGD